MRKKKKHEQRNVVHLESGMVVDEYVDSVMQVNFPCPYCGEYLGVGVSKLLEKPRGIRKK